MNQIQLLNKLTHLQPRQRLVHPLLAASAETGMETSSYSAEKRCRRLRLLGQCLGKARSVLPCLLLDLGLCTALSLPGNHCFSWSGHPAAGSLPGCMNTLTIPSGLPSSTAGLKLCTVTAPGTGTPLAPDGHHHTLSLHQ